MKRVVLSVLFLASALNPVWAADPLVALAREFGKSMSTLKRPRLGILSFPYHDGKISSGSSILSERLTTYMADLKDVRVIERTLLKKVLEEQHLAETGALNAFDAQRVGQILDVDVLLVGTLNDVEGDQTELNARILRSDTGEVLAAKRIFVDRVWSDRPHNLHPTPMPAMVEEDVKPVANEAIKLGVPSGRGGYYYGSR